MVELVDTQVLGTCAVRRGGSTPSKGTISEKKMKFILILYYCLATCQTVVYPEVYWGKKDCLAVTDNVIKMYRTVEGIDARVQIGSGCIEEDFTMMRLPL